MQSIVTINTVLFVSAVFVLIGIFSSLIASRVGAPLLLVFLGIGMLAGQDGPGGLSFDDYYTTYMVGSLALAVILFDGGLRTKLSSFKGVLAPSILLSTLGVATTAGITSVFAMLTLGMTPLEGFLLGAIVGSTDAAAVFFLLHAGGLRLPARVGATLEIESATNDPAAIFLTVLLVSMLGSTTVDSANALALDVARQVVLGGLFGVGGGLVMAFLLNRLDLPNGLHPIFVIASAVAVFGLTALLEGSGFLAVYLAGLVLGNRPVRAIASVVSFHDAATWFFQIIMFLVLGLLVTPSTLVDYSLPGIAVALGLTFIARPIAVLLFFKPFGYGWRETAFISWVGLRGAVSIFLAAIPMLSGLPAAEALFNVAFFVVLFSLLVQGWTLLPLAHRLGLALPQMEAVSRRIELDLPGQLEQEMVGYPLLPGSAVLSHNILPSWARLVLVVRDGRIFDPWETGALKEGDYAYVLAPPQRAYRLDRLFAGGPDRRLEGEDLFGVFRLKGDVPLARLAELYGLELPSDVAGLSIAELFADRFDEQPQPGDRITVGAATLIVQRVHDQRVTAVGLMLEDLAGSIIGQAFKGERRMQGLRRRTREALAALRRLLPWDEPTGEEKTRSYALGGTRRRRRVSRPFHTGEPNDAGSTDEDERGVPTVEQTDLLPEASPRAGTAADPPEDDRGGQPRP